MSSFIEFLDKFDNYCRLQVTPDHSEETIAKAEARRRLVQMNWIVERIRVLHAEFDKWGRQAPWPPPPEIIDVWETPIGAAWAKETDEKKKNVAKNQYVLLQEMETMAECFYWIAHRTRSVIRFIPKLQNFESKGARDVRNKLIEHPEKPDSKILTQSFSIDAERGVVIKAVRLYDENQDWKDQGIYKNFSNFQEDLLAKILSVLT